MKQIILTISLIISSLIIASAQEAPREWVDPDTGHRIVRLSDDPGSSSFYFHQNGYTANGDKLVFSTRGGLSTYNFNTKKIEQIVEGRTGDVIVGPKTRKVFYLKGDTVYETDVMQGGKNWEIRVAPDGKLISKKVDNEESEKSSKKESEEDEKDEHK